MFEFRMKSYVRNTINLSCANIVFPSVIFSWGIMKLMLEDGDQAGLIYAGRLSRWFQKSLLKSDFAYNPGR